MGEITQTDFGYTGQRGLPGTGLMDYRARFYAPALGRFIQPDSIVPGTENPQAWNRYSYVLNSPLDYIDPTGHDPHWCTDASCRTDYYNSMMGLWRSAHHGGSGGGGNDVIIFPGSYGSGQENNLGPGEPDYDMPAWTTDQYGNPVQFVQYPGTSDGITAKFNQALNAQGLVPKAAVTLICYSGGTEGCLMYAKWRVEQGQAVSDIVLLGPTFVAHNESGVLLDQLGTPDMNGEYDDWADYLQFLHNNHVDILIVDDAANSAIAASPENSPSCSSLYTFDNTGISHNHWGNNDAGDTATTTSQKLKQRVYDWIFDRGWVWP